MKYSSIQEIIDDRTLGVSGVDSNNIEALRNAIETKLRLMQSDTTTSTPESYRRLVDARAALDRLTKQGTSQADTAIIPMPSVLVERFVDALQKVERVPEKKPERPTEPTPKATIEQMRATRIVAVTKASQDFRNRRTLPLAALGTLVSALWATRQAFGANLSHAGTLMWASSAGGILVATIMLFLVTLHVQNQDEQVLRSLFDADVQAEAVGLLRESQFTRQEFREALWYIASEQYKRGNRLRTRTKRVYRKARRQLQDSLTQLDHLDQEIDRLKHEYEELNRKRRGLPYRMDEEIEGKRQEILNKENEILNKEREAEVARRNTVKRRIQCAKMTRRLYFVILNPRGRNYQIYLSTVNLVDGLDDAAQLAIVRLSEMGAIESGHNRGTEYFRIIGRNVSDYY